MSCSLFSASTSCGIEHSYKLCSIQPDTAVVDNNADFVTYTTLSGQVRWQINFRKGYGLQHLHIGSGDCCHILQYSFFSFSFSVSLSFSFSFSLSFSFSFSLSFSFSFSFPFFFSFFSFFSFFFFFFFCWGFKFSSSH